MQVRCCSCSCAGRTAADWVLRRGPRMLFARLHAGCRAGWSCVSGASHPQPKSDGDHLPLVRCKKMGC